MQTLQRGALDLARLHLPRSMREPPAIVESVVLAAQVIDEYHLLVQSRELYRQANRVKSTYDFTMTQYNGALLARGERVRVAAGSSVVLRPAPGGDSTAPPTQREYRFAVPPLEPVGRGEATYSKSPCKCTSRAHGGDPRDADASAPHTPRNSLRDGRPHPGVTRLRTWAAVRMYASTR